MIIFVPVNKENIEAYALHKEAIVIKSGIEGNTYYNPYSKAELEGWSFPKEHLLETSKREIYQIGWQKAWALTDSNSGEIMGSLDLVGGFITSNLHRCTLMMGIDSKHRGKGFAHKIIEFAKNFCLASNLSYLDLAVFSNNEIAHKLYLKHGFKEYGRKESSFIIDGTCIDEVLMSFKL